MSGVKVGSLCSGYGGLDHGLALGLGVAVEHSWFVEYDAAPSKILAHHYPDVPNHGDVKTTDWASVEPVDWLTAGYPCQPFSHAGKRAGADDPRHLWPDVARAIGALRPRGVLLENVAGHVSLGLGDVLWDLAALGYDATWGVVRAADAGAPHGRARIFIVAHPQGNEGRVGHGDDVRAGRREDGRGSASGRGAAPDSGRGSLPRAAVVDDGLRLTAERGLLAAADADGEGREGAVRLGRPDAGWAAGRGGAAAHADDDGLELLRGVDAGERDAHGRGSADVAWGPYQPAIRRWERVLGRPAPRPTERGRVGERLSPRFVEWLMGLDEGWVTDVPGLARNAQLKALGNGVVPQQAALAVRLLSGQAQAVAA